MIWVSMRGNKDQFWGKTKARESMLTMNIGCFKTARVAIPWEIKPNLPPIGIELLFGPIRNNSRSWKFSFFFFMCSGK